MIQLPLLKRKRTRGEVVLTDMPRSKRAKVVHLSKTTKKGKELSLKLYAAVQECIPSYSYLYVFRVDNMRNAYLKDVRTRLPDSRFEDPSYDPWSAPRSLTLFRRLFFGKTKVMAKALGTSASTEPWPNISALSAHLHGDVGLLFSPRPLSDLLAFFNAFQPSDFARSGTAAIKTVSIPAGEVFSRGGNIPSEDDVPLSHSLEPNLRKLGMPTRLVKGHIILDNEFTICRKDEILGSGQTSLLKIFDIAMAQFKVDLVAYFETGSSVVHTL